MSDTRDPEARPNVPFEVMTGEDERGLYVQVRGVSLRQIVIEPRADNVVRIREVPR